MITMIMVEAVEKHLPDDADNDASSAVVIVTTKKMGTWRALIAIVCLSFLVKSRMAAKKKKTTTMVVCLVLLARTPPPELDPMVILLRLPRLGPSYLFSRP